MCRDGGGEWFPAEGCSKPSCGYTIAADITLPALEIEFAPVANVELEPIECDQPATISANVVKGQDGKYKIELSGSYPDCSACCPVETDVEIGPRRAQMRSLDYALRPMICQGLLSLLTGITQMIFLSLF